MGSRHSLALSLAGVLKSAGWTVEQAFDFVEKLCTSFNDEEADDRQRCVESTFAKDGPIAGRSKLAEIATEEVATVICKWFGIASKTPPAGHRHKPHGEFATEDDYATAFADAVSRDLIFVPQTETWHKKRNGILAPIDIVEVQKDLQEFGAKYSHLGECNLFKSSHGIDAIIKLLKPKLAVDFSVLDHDTRLVGCESGILNLRTRQIVASNGVVTHKLGTVFDPNATCPTFVRFLNDIFDGNQDMIACVRRCLGYTLQGDVGEQCVFICIGSGSNGKSTFLNVVRRLMGTYAENVSPKFLVASNATDYELATLKGKRFVTCHEADRNARLDEEKLKLLTGGDPLTARVIYGAPETFPPSHKLWVATNELPRIHGVNQAIWRRLKQIIRFPVTIQGDDVDIFLEAKLFAELPGILNFALDGYDDWTIQGLKPPASVEAEWLSYKSECDPVGAFVELKCTKDSGTAVSAQELFDAYLSYCEDHFLSPIAKSSLGKILIKKGFVSLKKREGNHWSGIALK